MDFSKAVKSGKITCELSFLGNIINLALLIQRSFLFNKIIFVKMNAIKYIIRIDFVKSTIKHIFIWIKLFVKATKMRYQNAFPTTFQQNIFFVWTSPVLLPT